MKQRTPGRVFIPIVMVSIIAIIMMVFPSNIESKPGFLGFFANTWNHFVETFSNWMSIVFVAISFIMLLIVNSINKVIETQKFQKLSTQEQERYLEVSQQNYFTTLWRSGRERQSEEEEEAIVLDHGFDGIKELDNALPQWWMAMFYMGIVFAVVYMIAYGFTDFAHADIEYEEHNATEQAKVDKWIQENDITLEGAVNKYTDSQAMEEGEKIYEQTCATCHTANGGGGIGPNLTDDYWVNKTQSDLFSNIYSIIYDGSPKNAQMRAFGQRGELTGLAIEKVASYVYYLNQEAALVSENEGGAKPQGDKVSEWSRK
ncbi:MAG: cbb3-type cytochrome c oxidase N-terminal domain-containing protein [Moheibacter sp.]